MTGAKRRTPGASHPWQQARGQQRITSLQAAGLSQDEARALAARLEAEANKHYDDAYDRRQDAEMAIWGRAFEKAEKLAMLYALSRSVTSPQLTPEAYRWGWDMAEFTTKRLLYMADCYVYDSEFDKELQKVLRILRAVHVGPGRAVDDDVRAQLCDRLPDGLAVCDIQLYVWHGGNSVGAAAILRAAGADCFISAPGKLQHHIMPELTVYTGDKCGQINLPSLFYA